MEGIDLRGKDYLTREEAAHYACVSVRHFDTIRRTRNIPVLDWAGKKVFRREDIQRAIEACQQSRDAGGRGISTGRRADASTAEA